jgi:hypothetical protein
VWFRLVLLFVMLAGGLALYSVTRGAQTPSLADRIARLKTEINSVPTNASNHAEPNQRPADVPRRSYTQMEFDIARELQKPVYVFLPADAAVRIAAGRDRQMDKVEYERVNEKNFSRINVEIKGLQ